MAAKAKKNDDQSGQKEILVAQGVNLDLLGKRESSIYGAQSLEELNSFISAEFLVFKKKFFNDFSLNFYQSNDEHRFLEKLTEKPWAGAIVNAGAWTHTSLALGDRLAAVSYPFFEVHLSNLSSREAFRQFSYLAPHAQGVFSGAGKYSYTSALYALMNIVNSN